MTRNHRIVRHCKHRKNRLGLLLSIVFLNQVSAFIDWEGIIEDQFTEKPSKSPTLVPSQSPSLGYTSNPSGIPSFLPTVSISPSLQPTLLPSNSPSAKPSEVPSSRPTHSPTITPTLHPSTQPTALPTDSPSHIPTLKPSNTPTISSNPSEASLPSVLPSLTPTKPPSFFPSEIRRQETVEPSSIPSDFQSITNTSIAMTSLYPSLAPSGQISPFPSLWKRDISFEFVMELPSQNILGTNEIESFELNAYNLVTNICTLPSNIMDIDSVNFSHQKFSLEGSTLLVKFTIDGTTQLEVNPAKSEFEDKVVRCFEDEYTTFSHNILSAMSESSQDEELSETNQTPFPALITIVCACSFVAIVALLSTYFLTKRKSDKQVRISVSRKKSKRETSQEAVEHIDSNEIKGNTENIPNNLSSDSFLSISYGDGKLLGNNARRPTNHLNIESIMIQEKPEKERVYSKSQNHMAQIDRNNISQRDDYGHHKIKMQVLSPLAKKYDVDTSFDNNIGKSSVHESKSYQNNRESYQESNGQKETYENLGGSLPEGMHGNLKAHADSLTTLSEDNFVSHKKKKDSTIHSDKPEIESIMESLNSMMDDMQTFMKADGEEGIDSQGHVSIEQKESGDKSQTTAGTGTILGLNLPSFAREEADNMLLSQEIDDVPHYKKKDSPSIRTEAVDKNDACTGLSWLNLIDAAGKEKSAGSMDGESYEDLLSVVASGDYGSSTSGKSRFSQRLKKMEV